MKKTIKLIKKLKYTYDINKIGQTIPDIFFIQSRREINNTIFKLRLSYLVIVLLSLIIIVEFLN